MPGSTNVRRSRVPAPRRRALIPTYIYPTWFSSNPYWDALTADPVDVSYVVFNDASGHAAASNSDYVHQKQSNDAVGLKTLWYVETSYGAEPGATVDAEVLNGINWYAVDGVFFDEASSLAGDLAYYQARANYVRANSPSGKGTVVFNHGASPDEGYAAIADIMVVFEGTGASYAAWTPASWIANYPESRFSHLVYDSTLEPALSTAKNHNVGHIYVTDSTFAGNPWDELASYWATEQDQLNTPPSNSLSRGLAETVGLADAVARGAQAFARPFGESLPVADGLARTLAAPRALTASLPLADGLARGGVVSARALAASLPLADGLGTSTMFARALAESVGVADALARSAGVYVRPIAASLQLVDGLAGVSSFTRPLSGAAVPLADSVAMQRGTSRDLDAHTLGLADTASRSSVGMGRSLTESLPLADSLFAGVSAQAAITAAVGLADVLARQVALPRAASEPFALTDSLARSGAASRAMSAAVGMADAMSRGGAGHPRPLAEPLGLADVLARGAVGLPRTLAETVALAATLAAANGKSRALTASLPVADSLARTATGQQRALAETIVLAAVMTRDGGLAASMTASLPLSDSLTRQTVYARGIAATLPLADTVAHGPVGLSRFVPETVVLAAVLFAATGSARSFATGIGLADTLESTGIGRPRGLAALLGVDIDVTAGAVGQLRTLDETLGLAVAVLATTDSFQRPGYVVYIAGTISLLRPGHANGWVAPSTVRPGSGIAVAPGTIRR